MTLREALEYDPREISFGTSGLRALASDMTDLECYINTAGFLYFLSQQGNQAKTKELYVAGDLRQSTPRVLVAVTQAITDAGLNPVYCGLIPTPALALYAKSKNAACIMVTGSHIPADRNGIKFYKFDGEIMKEDEVAIKASVAVTRAKIYESDSENSAFDTKGMLKSPTLVGDPGPEAESNFENRYVAFGSDALDGKHVVVYQHSAVGRDFLASLLEKLGAKVTKVGRSDVFISIDTENVTLENKQYFRSLAEEYPDNFAIVSTDGDSDRPFVIDETGEFHRGDVVGAIVAKEVGADFAAVPISANDAINEYLSQAGVKLKNTKIGSPFVIKAMNEAEGSNNPVSWEVNGGFLHAKEIKVHRADLKPLPTRDAFLPLVAVLIKAVEENKKVSDLFAELPRRFTGGALLDDVDEGAISKLRNLAEYKEQVSELIENEMKSDELGEPSKVDFTDGVRITFEHQDVVHIRPSGNAPQLRVYTNCDTQERADNLAHDSVEPGGLLEKFVKAI